MATLSRADIERMPEGLSKAVLLRALRQSDEQHAKAEVKRIADMPDVPMYDKAEKRAERDLQAQCEGWLRQRGYRPQTAPEVFASGKAGATEVKGWYVHLFSPRNNPLMPDLLVMDERQARCLAIELKVRPTYQPGQREQIEAGRWRVAWGLKEVEGMVKEWERECLANDYTNSSLCVKEKI